MQGTGAALLSPAALALPTELFPNPRERGAPEESAAALEPVPEMV